MELLINSFIQETNDLEVIIKNLFEKGIMTKYYEDENLLLVYNKFNTYYKTPLVSECRSLIVNLDTNNIITYTGNTPIYNYEGYNYLLQNKDVPKEIYECYEGTTLTVFNHKNKWFVSSRRCLDANNSLWNKTTHYDMFIDVLQKQNLTFESFTEHLNPNLSYYFILIHHQNKQLIDYTNQFGEDYAKLVIIDIRDNELINQDINTFNLLGSHIILSKKFNSIEEFDNNNLDFDLTKTPESEGIIIKLIINKKTCLIKLQNLKYQFYKAMGPEKHLYRGFINLYQKDKLKEFFNNKKSFIKYKKIINPLNNKEEFDIIGCVDAVFRVMTTELETLFHKLWDKKGKKKDNDIYNNLPKIYKEILFGIRGIFFKKKNLKIGYIYSFLKNLDTEKIINFLRNRKKLFNWIRINNYTDLKDLNIKCNKVHLKLISIYTNKLFPEKII